MKRIVVLCGFLSLFVCLSSKVFGGTLWLTNNSPYFIEWGLLDSSSVYYPGYLHEVGPGGVDHVLADYDSTWQFYAVNLELGEDITYSVPGSGDWGLNYLGTGDVGTFTPVTVPEPATGSLLFYAAGWAVSYFLTRQIRP